MFDCLSFTVHPFQWVIPYGHTKTLLSNLSLSSSPQSPPPKSSPPKSPLASTPPSNCHLVCPQLQTLPLDPLRFPTLLKQQKISTIIVDTIMIAPIIVNTRFIASSAQPEFGSQPRTGIAHIVTNMSNTIKPMYVFINSSHLQAKNESSYEEAICTRISGIL